MVWIVQFVTELLFLYWECTQSGAVLLLTDQQSEVAARVIMHVKHVG